VPQSRSECVSPGHVQAPMRENTVLGQIPAIFLASGHWKHVSAGHGVLA
jgi:hypothetical protein